MELYTVEQVGRAGEVPVYAWLCSTRWVVEWVGAEYVHGKDGMGDSFFPAAKQRAEPEHAVDELVRRINESPGELTILAQAPLTNIVGCRRPRPADRAQGRGPVRDGGGGVGNITPAAEYNFYVDPEAAKIVLNAGFPLMLFTWTLTRTPMACSTTTSLRGSRRSTHRSHGSSARSTARRASSTRRWSGSAARPIPTRWSRRRSPTRP